MLTRLEIDNYTLIERSEIDFNNGFSVITGETGAGKSILLGALGMLMGGKVESKYFKDAEKKCVIEATFDISDYGYRPFFEENELDYDDECVIRKEITPSGKARSFVNDTPVSVSQLKQIGEMLIDIHSQHQNLLLKDSGFQLSVVDSVADTKKELSAYQSDYKQWSGAKRELERLKEQMENDARDADYLKSQLEKLQAANLVDGEQEELETENNLLQNAETIKTTLSSVVNLVEDDDNAVNVRLKQTVNLLSSVVMEVADRVEFNQERIDFVSSRLDTIYTLEKRHKVNTVAELKDIQADLERRVNNFSSADEQIASLEADVAKYFQQMEKSATSLSEKRQGSLKKIESTVEASMSLMGMPLAKLSVDLQKSSQYTLDGADEVTFLFSANKDKRMLPIAEIASGGEVSRVMLSLKSLLSEVKKMPTIILDEVDTGISGEVAARMGEVMSAMGKRMQVVAITHLPQIASKGETHYKVYKEEDGDKVVSHIVKLSPDERVTEIAQMLSGHNPSEAAIQNAKDLLGR
ncbi:MAG: DNA repair protein RecN [Paludibacteraceae bacterium]|nr:DNA repair protein RecN [Paludibacteraceae bacterium]